MSRCIVCNRVMRPDEIVWDKEKGVHETHCSSCLNKHKAEEYDTVINWDESEST